MLVYFCKGKRTCATVSINHRWRQGVQGAPRDHRIARTLEIVICDQHQKSWYRHKLLQPDSAVLAVFQLLISLFFFFN